MRIRYRSGCVWRRGDVWYFRAGRNTKAHRIGTTAEYPTETKARKAAQPLLIAANNQEETVTPLTFGALISKYKKEAMPVRVCTSKRYLGILQNHIEPQWKDAALKDVTPYAVEQWLSAKKLAPHTRQNIKSLMSVLFEKAMFWSLIPTNRNPMELITVRGSSKPLAKRHNLSVEEFELLVKHLEEPYDTMAWIQILHGLRVSELIGLKWGDVNWLQSEVIIQRSVVERVEDETKTRASKARLPLTKKEMGLLKSWRQKTPFTDDADYIFASWYTNGKRPLTCQVYAKALKEAAKKAGLPHISTHCFRHTYRSWLTKNNTSAGLTKSLMRHANISTTFNVYGESDISDLRREHEKVVAMFLG